jgi:hypothetical protein
MSPDDVVPHEMNAPHDFDDAAVEALLNGDGQAIDAAIAAFVDELRIASNATMPSVSAELGALFTSQQPVETASTPPRRLERLRTSTLAKIAAATAAIIAATGGLAVANALPAPIQHLVAGIGIGKADNGHQHAVLVAETSTTTTVTSTTDAPPSTTAATTSDQYGVVAPIAHEHNDGCDHGIDASQVASAGHRHNNANNGRQSRPCESTTTTSLPRTPGKTQGNTARTEHGQGRDGTPSNTDAPRASPASAPSRQSDSHTPNTHSGK